MRPDLCFATTDDEIEADPMTVPRPRAVSGVVLRADADETTLVDVPVPADSSAPGLDEESGVYPIFDDGEAALRWMTHKRAVQKCAQDIEARPDDPRVYLERARVMREGGSITEALDDCARALAIRPDFVDAHLARAEIHAELGRHEEVLVDASRALRLDASRKVAYRLRAAARLALSDLHGTVADYDHAILLDANDSTLFRDRGDVKSRMADLAGALDDLSVAVAMNPGDDDAAFKRALVKIMLADGRLDWSRAAAKALEQLAARGSDDDGRIA